MFRRRRHFKHIDWIFCLYIVYTRLPKVDLEQYSSKCVAGILGNVAEGRADVGLGALYLWYHEYQFLDYSTPYIRTGITCLAPKPELLSALFLFVRPFTLITWIIVICVLCIAIAALFFIKKLDIFIKRGYRTGAKALPTGSSTNSITHQQCVYLSVQLTFHHQFSG